MLSSLSETDLAEELVGFNAMATMISNLPIQVKVDAVKSETCCRRYYPLMMQQLMPSSERQSYGIRMRKSNDVDRLHSAVCSFYRSTVGISLLTVWFPRIVCQHSFMWAVEQTGDFLGFSYCGRRRFSYCGLVC